MGETFTVSRIELKKLLVALNVSEKNIVDFETAMKKSHKHVNAVAFAGMLMKYGLKQKDVADIMRRVGIDDLVISDILNTLDEERIGETFGRVVELSVE